ncbi:hypothetical protein [Nostoc sp. UIC 10630]|uniref:hypothetical protein n=1 Tax=Nostoc sp. UIC 10630 TaxID=2100146 RepID=UPI0013D2BC2B|nr:hypothetical protein [Nostoc sp. UIC 10630]NEU81847.1 hypothetical protein [Nostoc sp. UIC 10630]
MSSFSKKIIARNLIHRLPLRSLLIVPFVLQIFAAVGLTGYISLRNGQKAVNDVSVKRVNRLISICQLEGSLCKFQHEALIG